MASIYFPKNNIASSLSYNYLFDSYIIFPSLFISTKVWWRFPNFCVRLLDQVVHVCYTYGEIFKINLECCLKLDYTILTSLFLTHLLVNLCRIKARKKKTAILLYLKDLMVPCPSCAYNTRPVPGGLQFWLPCLLFPSGPVQARKGASLASWSLWFTFCSFPQLLHMIQMFSSCAASALPPLQGKKYAAALAPFLISQKGNTLVPSMKFLTAPAVPACLRTPLVNFTVWPPSPRQTCTDLQSEII